MSTVPRILDYVRTLGIGGQAVVMFGLAALLVALLWLGAWVMSKVRV